jgi:hypothetical protein
MNAAIHSIAAACLFLFAATARGDDAELKRLQGRFERTFTNKAGVQFRTIKDVAGDQSTVTTFDDVGNIVEEHRSTFKVEKRGSVNVLSFFNVVVTAGPDKGSTDPATRSYIYRLDGDNFAEAWGLLDGDNSPPRMFYWKKTQSGQ